MITLPPPQETTVLADARHLTVWQAMCLHRECQNRRRGSYSLEEPVVTQWAANHAAPGDHTIAVWCVIAGQQRWRPLLIRCVRGGQWPLWQWVCLLPHAGRSGAPWMRGECSSELARQRWLDHDCTTEENHAN